MDLIRVWHSFAAKFVKIRLDFSPNFHETSYHGDLPTFVRILRLYFIRYLVCGGSAMAAKHKPKKLTGHEAGRCALTHKLRIIGGKYRGRKLLCNGDPGVRPMKNRVREAVFNLIGPAGVGMHAVDLFAGTGALALEALSRGAARVTMVERHFPTAQVIRQNVHSLAVEEQIEIVTADAFYWVQHKMLPGEHPYVVFCSPPYRFFVERADDMRKLIRTVIERAVSGSTIVVESDGRFDVSELPERKQWDVRAYPPAIVSLRRL